MCQVILSHQTSLFRLKPALLSGFSVISRLLSSSVPCGGSVLTIGALCVDALNLHPAWQWEHRAEPRCNGALLLLSLFSHGRVGGKDTYRFTATAHCDLWITEVDVFIGILGLSCFQDFCIWLQSTFLSSGFCMNQNRRHGQGVLNSLLLWVKYLMK